MKITGQRTQRWEPPSVFCEENAESKVGGAGGGDKKAALEM